MPIVLIVFRESLEAFLIVGVLLSLLGKFRTNFGIFTVILATVVGFAINTVLLFGASMGVSALTTLFDEEIWELVEGVLMLTSAGCITYVVFWLHRALSHQKSALLAKAHDTIQKGALIPLFAITLTAVIREGIEIVLILAPYLTTQTLTKTMLLAVGGIVGAVGVVALFYQTTSKVAIRHVIQINSLLLILFAGGLIINGVHELAEKIPLVSTAKTLHASVTLLPNLPSLLEFVTAGFFGWKRQVTMIEALSYSCYLIWMARRLRTIAKATNCHLDP